MTTMRGTRVKIFLYLCAIFIISGLVVCFKNAISQVDDEKKNNEICRQQQENLSTQLQVISDYKQRLENSLKSEKAEHQQTKINNEIKANEEKLKSEKIMNEAKNKFNSLQQHFNLLQTQYDDFKETSSRIQEKQLKEINDLQSKLTEVQEQLKKIEAVKESLKAQYTELQVIKEDLEKQVQSSHLSKSDREQKILSLTQENSNLKHEMDAVKDKCSKLDTLQEPAPKVEISSPTNLQRPIGDNKLLGVLSPPNQVEKGSSSKSSTVSAVSPGKLNGARPLSVPTMTPESVKKNILKIPEGVVPVPEKADSEVVNNRYKSQISDANVKEDKDTGAQEEFDVPGHGINANGYENIGIGVKNDDLKVEKKHIDTLGVDEKKVFEPNEDMVNDNNDLQGEDPEDDDPDYGVRNFQDPPVRN